MAQVKTVTANNDDISMRFTKPAGEPVQVKVAIDLDSGERIGAQFATNGVLTPEEQSQLNTLLIRLRDHAFVTLGFEDDGQ